mgnify:CR=1 FL=1
MSKKKTTEEIAEKIENTDVSKPSGRATVASITSRALNPDQKAMSDAGNQAIKKALYQPENHKKHITVHFEFNQKIDDALMQKLENLFLFRESYWGKDYATSPETYCGYGPYRITAADSSQIILEPNPNWWGAPVTEDFDRIICRAD